MSRYRLLFLLPALLLSMVVAGLGGTSFQRQLESFQTLGFEAAYTSGVFMVLDVSDPATGLMAGDLVLQARQQEPKDLQSLGDLLLANTETPLLIKRGEALEAVAYVRPQRQIDFVYLALAAVGLFNLLIGLYTTLKDPRPQTALFFLWCMASAALFLLSPRAIPLDSTDELIFLGDQWARVLMPALTLHFLWHFPVRITRPGMGALLAACYLPALFSLPFYTDQILLGGRYTGAPSASWMTLLDRMELLLIPAASLAAAALLAVRLYRRPEWEHRRQLYWIAAGLVAGYLPFLLAYVLPWSLGFKPSTGITLATVLPMGLVPLAFAYAIFKYRLLDMGVLLRDAVSYTAAGIVALFGFQGAQLLIYDGLGADFATARNMLTFAAGLAIAGVLVPTRNAVAHGLEQLQHRGLWGRRRLLQALGGSLLHERNLETLCSTLVDELTDGLMARTELYLIQGDGDLQPMRRREELPPSFDPNSLGEDLWQRSVTSLSAVQLPTENASAQQTLFAAGFRYAFPLRVQGHPVGLILMAYKYDEEPLDGEDLELVQGLLSQAALAIENARLLGEVRTQLREVGRLEALNHGILESSPVGIAMLDSNLRVVSANRSLAEICRVEGFALEGSALKEILPVTLPAAGEPPMEIGFCLLSGEERYLQVQVAGYRDALIPDSAAQMLDAGADIQIQGLAASPQVVLVVQDVTEQASMEAQLREKEHLASLGMLAAGVAHEVNTPLTGISSYAQFMMASTAEDDPRFELLQKMERQTFRASQIVNNLLEFARNRRGEMGRVDLSSVLSETLTLLEVRAAKADVELLWQAPEHAHLVLGNEGELHQVFTNLIANAVDALQDHPSPRQVTVTVEDLGLRQKIRVSDTGPGIPPERLQSIFKPFFSSKLGRGGSGLGLAITYNILRRHAGEIRAENHPDDEPGCTFTVELPSYQAVTH